MSAPGAKRIRLQSFDERVKGALGSDAKHKEFAEFLLSLWETNGDHVNAGFVKEPMQVQWWKRMEYGQEVLYAHLKSHHTHGEWLSSQLRSLYDSDPGDDEERRDYNVGVTRVKNIITALLPSDRPFDFEYAGHEPDADWCNSLSLCLFPGSKPGEKSDGHFVVLFVRRQVQ